MQVLPQLPHASGLYAQLNRAWAQTSTLLADEYRAILRAAAAAQGQPLFKGFAGFAADR
ncbi:hypothetical protein D3C80_1995360 [compost metagenome]